MWGLRTILPTSVLPRAKNQMISRQPPFLKSLEVVPTDWRRSTSWIASASRAGSKIGWATGTAIAVATRAASQMTVFIVLVLGFRGPFGELVSRYLWWKSGMLMAVLSCWFLMLVLILAQTTLSRTVYRGILRLAASCAVEGPSRWNEMLAITLHWPDIARYQGSPASQAQCLSILKLRAAAYIALYSYHWLDHCRKGTW
jgi:hypothetical protein